MLGVAGISVIGGVFGGFAISAQNQEKADCTQTCSRYAQSLTDYNYAQMNATAATALFIAGGALVATGIVLWIVAPRSSIVVAPGVGALTVRGTF